MMAFSATLLQDDHQDAGYLPLLRNTEIVLAAWATVFVFLSLLVKYVYIGSSDELEFHSFAFWRRDTLTIQKIHDTVCPRRRARFFKCVKRCDRRKASQEAKQGGSSDGKAEWNCPFECSFAKIHMPAPLPFRKKKRSKAARTTVPVDNKKTTAVSTSQPEEETPQDELVSNEAATTSSFSTTPTTKLARKSKRRHHRKRLETESSTESDSSRSHNSSRDEPAFPIPSLPVTSTLVIDLAMMQNWPQLLVNLKANRRGARQRDADGLYALHWAVSGAPPLQVVEALLRAYPGAVKKVDSEGSNALHFASHYGGSVAMMELLLNTYPKAIGGKDKYGRSPLYHAVDKSANIDVLRTLASADPTMVTSPCRPKNYQELEQEGKSLSYLTPLFLAWVNVLTDRRSAESCSGKIFDKARLLLDIAYCERYGLEHAANATNIPLLAAILSLDDVLPGELAEVVIQKAQEKDLLEGDPLWGKNPLALVASIPNMSSERSSELIGLLLEACPKAATILDREWRTPLANAAAAGKSWEGGLDRLFLAAPQALGWTDKEEGLPPSLLAAASSPLEASGCQAKFALLADPYKLVGVKTMSLRMRALKQHQHDAKQDSSKGTTDAETNHLTTIYHLIAKDPAWIVKANI